MIEWLAAAGGEQGARLTLRPPRALTARQFILLFAALSGTMWLVAGMAWLAGNAYGPLFALLHTALLGGSLRWLWRQGERDEIILVSPTLVEVRRSAEPGPLFRAHPCWVRLRIGKGDQSVTLASSGKYMQVGAFLGPAERLELGSRLQELLAAVVGRDGETQGSGQ